MPEPSTRRGRHSKSRIVSAAADLMYERGVRATSVEHILAASGTGKSQFYHYFPDKDALVIEVLSHQLDGILEDQSRFALDSWEGIRAWFQTLLEVHENEREFHGCPLGSIAGEAIEQGEQVRLGAAAAFARWESAFAAALEAMRRRGELDRSADPAALAERVIAIIQGGYLLSSVKRDISPMRGTLQVALGHLESYSSSAGTDPPSEKRPLDCWSRLY
jgi:TetR/AcrR family transcriptional regulator, transcriptional repressor for nem operon